MALFFFVLMTTLCPMQRGFSLVELSIVLAILGLLTGGILAGQSLVHAAELRKVTNDFTRFETAVHGFRDRYFMLPGDIANATSFWGAADADGVGTDCSNLTLTATATCNGNGDGMIYNPVSASLTFTRSITLGNIWRMRD